MAPGLLHPYPVSVWPVFCCWVLWHIWYLVLAHKPYVLQPQVYGYDDLQMLQTRIPLVRACSCLISWSISHECNRNWFVCNIWSWVIIFGFCRTITVSHLPLQPLHWLAGKAVWRAILILVRCWFFFFKFWFMHCVRHLDREPKHCEPNASLSETVSEFFFLAGDLSKFGRGDASSPAPATTLAQPQQTQTQTHHTTQQPFLNPALPPGYSYTSLPYYTGVPGLPNTFQYGPAMFPVKALKASSQPS